MSPPTKPIKNAPRKPRPPTRDKRCCKPDGRAKSKAPNMEAAMAKKNSARGTTTQGLAKKVPKALPSSAKVVPSVPNMVAIPATYRVARATAWARRTPPRPPNTLMVMGIIG